MRKELIWVAIIGISFGLVIAFGFWRINANLKPKGTSTQKTPQPKTVNSEFKIALNKPDNNDVITASPMPISGITKPLSWIVISGEENDYIIQADEKGEFKQDVDLVSGINQIKITAFDAAGSQSVEKVLVVYSSAFETDEKIVSKPKAYIGTVTDITDSTIQIKIGGEIKQISTSDKVTVIKTGTTNKTVKLTDIAIGDFIVAMGYINSSSVLNSQRILITDPITEPKIEAKMGTISDIDKKATLSKALKTKLKTIKDDEEIVFVVSQEKDVLMLRFVAKLDK
ncbi:MAG TPA: hypothetical protein VL401_01465 [Alphaproteobacteria bacterium]|jgi:hypothetical protein|nr:hypothetical protein [Alphaproteobacteria bacterium]